MDTNQNKPVCKLIGTDGNAFAIIGNVSNTLKRAGLRREAEDFQKQAFAAGSYDEVLRLAMSFVDVC